MPDLQQEIEALRDEMCDTVVPVEGAARYWVDRLDRILARCAPKAEEWREPWKCECGIIWEDALPPGGRCLCGGTLVPYERRKGGAK